VEKWRGMTMLKVPKAGIQVWTGEVHGVLAFRREAMAQRLGREMDWRKSSTRSTELKEAVLALVLQGDIDLGVRSAETVS
jgi:hypothetical protein